MVGDPHDVIGRMRPDRRDFFPVADMDLGMWWWYPLPFKKPTATQKAQALEGEEEQSRWDEMTAPKFLTNNLTIGKPLWVGVQAYRKNKDSRFPTPLEYRSQAYVAIIAGAKGLMWYGGSVTNGMFALQDPTTRPVETHWEAVKRLATELRGLSDIFMSPTIATPKVAPDGALISVCIRQSPMRTVLLAANRGPDKIDVTFTSPQLPAGSAKVISENRFVQTSNGELHDTFDPYAVHVYEFSN
jgi:hypothetical protein